MTRKGGFEAGGADEEEVRWLQVEARGGSLWIVIFVCFN